MHFIYLLGAHDIVQCMEDIKAAYIIINEELKLKKTV